jgi:hypothetical protein
MKHLQIIGQITGRSLTKSFILAIALLAIVTEPVVEPVVGWAMCKLTVSLDAGIKAHRLPK